MESPFSSSSPFSSPPGGPSRAPWTPTSLIQLIPFLGDAVIVGVLLHFVASGFNGPLILPALAGAILGYFIAQSARKKKIRSKAGLLLLTMCCGLLCYGTRLVADIAQAREALIQVTALARSGGNPVLMARIEKQLRGQITPMGYLPTFFKDAAAKGVTLQGKHGYQYTFGGTGNRSSGDTPRNLNSVILYALPLAELLFLLGGAATVVWFQSAKPLCESCNEEQESQITILSLYDDQISGALKLLNRGNFAALTQFLNEDAQEAPRDKRSARLSFSKCSSCAGGQAQLVLTRDQRFDTLWESPVTPQEVVALEETREKWLEVAAAEANQNSLAVS